MADNDHDSVLGEHEATPLPRRSNGTDSLNVGPTAVKGCD
jgi:hypothetical protein